MSKSSYNTPRQSGFYTTPTSPTLSPSISSSKLSTHKLKELSDSNLFSSRQKNPPPLSPKAFQDKMYSTLPGFGKQLLSPKRAVILSTKETDALYTEARGTVLSMSPTKGKERLSTDMSKNEHLFLQDYGKKGAKKVLDNDKEDVKRLDEWQISFRRTKVVGDFADPNELLQQYKLQQYKHSEVEEIKDLPSVRKDLINRIIGDSDDEEESKKYAKERLPALLPDSTKFMAGIRPSDDSSKAPKSLEVMLRDNNKEVLSGLINKKIKESIRTTDVSLMTEEQLRIHVKKIAEGVIAQFQNLKGPAGLIVVNNSVEAMVKVLKSKSNDADKLHEEFQREVSMPNEVINDYEMMEDLMMEKFEICEQENEDLRNKVRQITIESYNIKKDLVSCQIQYEDIIKKYGNLPSESEREEMKKSVVKPIPIKKGKNHTHDEQRLKLQMTKVEKQGEGIELSKKLSELKDRLSHKRKEIQIRENELEHVRNQKEYYKTQLRDLYYKCLRDDAALLKEQKSQNSYAWVIRSLWKIKEDVQESAFPSFLDPNAIKFLLEYARLQNELEEFCKENNVMELISSVDDFKCLHKTLDLGSTPMDTSESSQHGNYMPFAYQQYKARDLESMLGDVRDRMASLKKVNLKAKRQVPVGKYGFKAKSVTYQWQDVDPTQIDKIVTSPNQEQPVVVGGNISINTNRNKNQKSDNPHQIAWEQGMEKLKSLIAFRKREVERVIKQNMPKELDHRLKLNIQKMFRFLFGKLGLESFARFLKEKAAYEQNAQGKFKRASLSGLGAMKASTTMSQPVSPTASGGGGLIPPLTASMRSSFVSTVSRDPCMSPTSPKNVGTLSNVITTLPDQLELATPKNSSPRLKVTFDMERGSIRESIRQSKLFALFPMDGNGVNDN